MIRWRTSRMLKNEDGTELSMEFEFNAKRIAVISNDPRIFDKHLRAIEARGLVVHLEPDIGEWWIQPENLV